MLNCSDSNRQVKVLKGKIAVFSGATSLDQTSRVPLVVLGKQRSNALKPDDATSWLTWLLEMSRKKKIILRIHRSIYFWHACSNQSYRGDRGVLVLLFYNRNSNHSLGGIRNLGASLLRTLPQRRGTAWFGIAFPTHRHAGAMCFVFRTQTIRGGEQRWADPNPLNITGHWFCACQCSEEARWIMIIVFGKMTQRCSSSYKFDYLCSCGHVRVEGRADICLCA